MSITTLKQHRCHGGIQGVYRHESSATRCPMELAVYVPPQAERGNVPVLYWLSGLTCTWANFTEKAGVQRHAAEHGLIIVAPDTSPRGTDFPGEHESYDFGSGAGFYVDATVDPWAQNYRMYSYVTKELPALIEANFPVDRQRQGIFGHSMGGHGALTIGLKNPETYRSISAFAPISAPMHCPWGLKAFTGYLGPDRERWRAYDACELIRSLPSGARRPPLLVDQGLADPFLEQQLLPERLEQACRESGVPLTLRRQPAYDHGYYFISTFVEDHLRHHARTLLG